MNYFARFFVVFLLIPYSVSIADTPTTSPNAKLTPSEVVHIIVDALKTNDPANDDDGIATVFEFASPGNKSATGPLQRFTQMIKGGFGDMLNHVDSDFGEIEMKDGTALQAVWLTSPSGKETGYVFQLGKQKSGSFEGMWMTESVWPIGAREPQGQSI